VTAAPRLPRDRLLPVGECPGSLTVDRVEDLEQFNLAGMAGGAVEIRQPIPFGRTRDSDLLYLWWLRDLTSHAIRLIWTLDGEPLLDHRDYSHLVPPRGPSGGAVARWRSAFRYGTFYYRVGPGFVTIKDVRPGGEHSRMTISGVDADRFLWLAQSSSRCPYDEPLEEALHALADADLARFTETSLVVLPFRIRHWPVPFLSV
jgi:hypothetical protein